MNKEQLREYLQSFGEATGYVQFLSQAGIETFKDPKEIDIEKVPLEIAFCNGKMSVTVRLLDGKWFVDETPVEKVTKEVEYLSVLSEKKVRIGQVWELRQDPNVPELQSAVFVKNVFLGFKGEQDAN